MGVQYKQKCYKCKKNYVLAIARQPYVICYDCQKDSLKGRITDPYYKKLFNISEEYYKKNAFLRNIKISYLKNRFLTETQTTTFKNVVQQMKSDIEFLKS